MLSELKEIVKQEIIRPEHPDGSKYSIAQDFGEAVPIFLWKDGVQIEDAAIKQLCNLSRMKFVHHHIAAMPDTHFGIGATVGCVFGSRDAVIPAAVGVDIGCGMIAAKTNLEHADVALGRAPAIRAAIEARIPMGRTNNGRQGDRGAWQDIPEDVKQVWNVHLLDGYERLVKDFPALGIGNSVNHLGTLGTGNHFIEIQYDENDQIWIMLHSGSRGVGNRIGNYFIARAKELMGQFNIQLPDKDLAFIPSAHELYSSYLDALYWAQDFALHNRKIMLNRTLEALNAVFPGTAICEEINTHHNYASQERHFGADVLLTRKGAIRARAGDLGIIPGSMGTGSFIVRGLGNPFSFHSCSHGAGRAMSRTEAKKRFTLDDHDKAMAGVEGRRDADVLDETPAAYKDINAVIAAQSDLIEVVHTMKQLVVCKG